jgi:uncharacterized protein
MANWDQVEGEGNVEDRRSSTIGASTGLGVIGTVIVLGFMLYTGGGNANDIGRLLESLSQSGTQTQQGPFQDTKKYLPFAQKVIASTNQVWNQEFKEEGYKYVEPKLVLFRGQTESGCGGADSRVGPHYCPTDKTVYLDETFFEELTTKFGAKGGQVAEAYVMAHEIGHHVQNITGVFGQLDVRDNATSVKAELQADCYAGVWAGIANTEGIINEAEIGQAIDAAQAVGDDKIQKSTTGRINPETWTHGSSAMRKQNFMTGFNGKDNKVCDAIIQ